MTLGGVGIVVAAISLAGCLGGGGGGGEGEPLRTLTQADVVDLPAGTGTGTTYSGVYAIDTIIVTGCHCRRGSCGVDVRPGGMFWASQQDGMFTQEFEGAPGPVARGGIDADGTYTVGSDSEDIYGVAYTLFEGQIKLVDGVPKGGVANLVSTVTGIPGINVDCDLTARETFHYEGPG